MLIYKATNHLNTKSYVGQTKKTLEERWKTHIKASQKKNCNNHFHNAIRKYGTNCWSLRTIEDNINNETYLNEREQYWISFFNTFENGYNSTNGGNQGRIYSKESIEKMANSLRGKKQSEETKLKRSLFMKTNNHFKNKHHDSKTRAIMSLRKLNAPLIKCPYCSVSSRIKSNMVRWHFDNCKHKF